MFGRHMTLLALKKPGVQNYFSLVRPNTGESYFDVEVCSHTQSKHPDSWAVHVQLGPGLGHFSHHQFKSWAALSRKSAECHLAMTS